MTDSDNLEGVTRSSVKLIRNAKGETQWELRVCVGDTEEQLNEARRIAVEQHAQLLAELGIMVRA